MSKHIFKNHYTTNPSDVESGDAFAIKVVAIAGYNNDWAAYVGPTDWPDEEVARHGDKLLAKQALPLFYVLRNTIRHYRE